MEEERTDAALVAAAKAGDKRAYAALVVRHRPMVATLCRRVLGDPGLAEDAVQEAALAALVDLERLRRPDRFGPWLAGIALNVCRRWLRRQRLETGTVDVADDRADPAAAAEVAEIRDRVQRAVRALPAGQRQAVAGFYLRGLTHAELAAELGIRVGAGLVEAGLDRAALRPRLSDLEPETTEATMTQTLIPMRVTDVHRLPADDGEVERHVVLLEEVDGERTLPIWIGPPEAAALAMTLQSVDLPRPLTHRFAAGLVEALGGTVRGCRITRLAEETFYAEVRMEGPSGAAVVDARPSDALTLALVAAAPVVVDAGVLDDVARRLPPDDLLENLTTAGGAQDVVARWMAGRPGR